MFALPWLIMALVAGHPPLRGPARHRRPRAVAHRVLDLADEVLTPRPSTTSSPLLDSVFGRGQTPLGLLGLVAAIWAGSRVIDASWWP